MNDVQVLYSSISNPLSENVYNHLLKLLPNELQQMNNAYKNQKDRHLHLTGKLLLAEGLYRFGFGSESLKNMRYDSNQKPYIPETCAFNIAHSGRYVICAMTAHGNIGVDIEQIKAVELSDFMNVMNKTQWESIRNSANQIELFFKLWTIKEAVIKAASLTLDELNNIETDFKTAWIGNRIWHIYPLVIDKHYWAHVASEMPVQSIKKEFITF